MTQIPEELLEQVPTWDFETLYEHFDLLEPDLKTKTKVNEGIDIKFPVEIIISENYEEFPRGKSVRVLGFGRINMFAFKREIRERKKIMLKFIYENYNTDVTTSRVGGKG